MTTLRGLRWWMMGLVMAGSIVNYLTRSTLAVAAPTVLKDLDLTTQQYSWILSAFQVAIAHPPDRSVVQRLGADVTDARAGGQARETAVGDERHVLAPWQVAERRGDLGRLLHAGARWPHADQHDHVALSDRSGGCATAI